MESPITIEKMAQLLVTWRTQRAHPRQGLPENLKAHLRQLLNTHSAPTIARSLGLSKSTVYSLIRPSQTNPPVSTQWASHRAAKDASPEPLGFIPLDPGPLAPAAALHPTEAQKPEPNVAPKAASTPLASPPLCTILHPRGATLLIHSKRPGNPV